MKYAVKDKTTDEVFRNNTFFDVFALINMKTKVIATDLLDALVKYKRFSSKQWIVIEEETET